MHATRQPGANTGTVSGPESASRTRRGMFGVFPNNSTSFAWRTQRTVSSGSMTSRHLHQGAKAFPGRAGRTASTDRLASCAFARSKSFQAGGAPPGEMERSSKFGSWQMGSCHGWSAES